MNSAQPVTPMTPTPAYAAVAERPYRARERRGPVDLHLDSNEGAPPPTELLEMFAAGGCDVLRCYPDSARLEALIAAEIGARRGQVLVTAGADDALARACRAMLGPGREIILPEPTFEMIGRYARLTGATVRSPRWLSGDFPLDDVLAAAGPRTAVIAVVSPNNPTGAVARVADLRRLSEEAPRALLIVDLAYVEFADQDLTDFVLGAPNAVGIRTFSKAWGLAGLRVGYVVGPKEIIGWLRSCGEPYAVSGPSLAVAEIWLERGATTVDAYVKQVRSERRRLVRTLQSLGADPLPSQANFVLARFPDARWVRDALAGLGIAVRILDDRPDLADSVRITCPGDEQSFGRMETALRTALTPEAILFDLDGVLADVSQSYREAILATALSFGIRLDRDAIATAKLAGNANNDWVLTRRLLAAHGVEATLSQVTERFEAFYQGNADRPGLRRAERLIVPRAQLKRWAARYPLAVVTGRPRAGHPGRRSGSGCLRPCGRRRRWRTGSRSGPPSRHRRLRS